MPILVRIQVMCTIDIFVEENHHGKSPRTKENVLSIISFSSLDKIPNIKICHVVANKHPEVIEGRQRLIAVDVLESEEAYEDASIDKDDANFDE